MIKKSRLVCGVGINDADYIVELKEIVGGKRKHLWSCPLHKAWQDMIRRCYSAKAHARRPTYVGCSVSPEWHSLMAFRSWMIVQPWEGMELDKDILIPGNKVYSPETCIFVSTALNSFMTDCSAVRGDCPVGVSWHKQKGKYQAYCRNPFSAKFEHLGYFTDPLQGHEVWRKRKHELACMYADQQTDPRIAQALRQRYSGIS